MICLEKNGEGFQVGMMRAFEEHRPLYSLVGCTAILPDGIFRPRHRNLYQREMDRQCLNVVKQVLT